VRGKQWEGELQGPTKGPPYEKKKEGEKRRHGPLTPTLFYSKFHSNMNKTKEV
jgi:hypothetical protein